MLTKKRLEFIIYGSFIFTALIQVGGAGYASYVIDSSVTGASVVKFSFLLTVIETAICSYFIFKYKSRTIAFFLLLDQILATFVTYINTMNMIGRIEFMFFVFPLFFVILYSLLAYATTTWTKLEQQEKPTFKKIATPLRVFAILALCLYSLPYKIFSYIIINNPDGAPQSVTATVRVIMMLIQDLFG